MLCVPVFYTLTNILAHVGWRHHRANRQVQRHERTAIVGALQRHHWCVRRPRTRLPGNVCVGAARLTDQRVGERLIEHTVYV